jgi:hypothetical protein
MRYLVRSVRGVNLVSGRVITPQEFWSVSYVHFDDKHSVPKSQSDDSAFGFRKDSRMLVVVGDLDEDEAREEAFYFVMENERLRLVHSTIVNKDCEGLRR